MLFMIRRNIHTEDCLLMFPVIIAQLRKMCIRDRPLAVQLKRRCDLDDLFLKCVNKRKHCAVFALAKQDVYKRQVVLRAYVSTEELAEKTAYLQQNVDGLNS